jgi:hypothetical protein
MLVNELLTPCKGLGVLSPAHSGLGGRTLELPYPVSAVEGQNLTHPPEALLEV